MIEDLLIKAGLGCGSKKNFQSEILKNMKVPGVLPRWYFLTPIKHSGNGLVTATINFAFPFVAKSTDTSDAIVLSRLENERKAYEDDLIHFIRSFGFIVPPDSQTFSIIPFWATETSERTERKDFAGLRIHILNAVITVKYRKSWFNQ